METELSLVEKQTNGGRSSETHNRTAGGQRWGQEIPLKEYDEKNTKKRKENVSKEKKEDRKKAQRQRREKKKEAEQDRRTTRIRTTKVQ